MRRLAEYFQEYFPACETSEIPSVAVRVEAVRLLVKDLDGSVFQLLRDFTYILGIFRKGINSIRVKFQSLTSKTGVKYCR